MYYLLTETIHLACPKANLYNSSVTKTQREFRRRFLYGPAPVGRNIRRFATRLEATGSTLDRRKSGRPRTGRSSFFNNIG